MDRKASLLKILMLLIRPAVRFALRNSLRLPDIIEAAKGVLVEDSRKELEQQALKANTSRISVMTGVHRRDVLRIQDGNIDFSYEKDLITRIVGQWLSDGDFLTKEREPRVLSIEGKDSEFAKLVFSVSRDINPGTVLFELERIEAIQKVKGGVKLLIKSVVPHGDPVPGFTILSNDSCDLLDTVTENIFDSPELPQFHARTEYDNVRPEALEELKVWFLKEGHKFHSKVRDIVSQHDQDVNPDPKFKGKGMRIVFSSFSNIGEKKS